MPSTKCLSLSGRALAVRANVVTECVHGIVLGTSHAAIEQNLVSSTESGLAFAPGSASNVDRDNTSRGNRTDFVNGGSDNSSGGGNFLPDPR